MRPETREILMQDLVNVEAIPYDVMKAGIDWQWESYGQYLDASGAAGSASTWRAWSRSPRSATT